MSYWIEERKTSAGKRWYVVRRFNRVKEYNPAGKLYPDAVKLRKHLEEREVKTHIKPFGIDLTLYALKQSYIEHSNTKRESTQTHIKRGVNKFFAFIGDQPVRNIGRHDLERYKQNLISKEHSPSGVNILLNPVISMFQYAVNMDWLDKNPAKGAKIKVERSAKFLNRKEIDQLLKVGCAFNKELAKIIQIALYTGMRLSEIPHARVNGGFLELDNTKTGNPRRIPIHAKIKDFLPLAGWSKWRIERAFRRAVLRSKLADRVRFHDLRHTFASNYLQSGGTIADLKLIGGWRSIQSLQVYAHFQPSYLKERMSQYKLN